MHSINYLACALAAAHGAHAWGEMAHMAVGFVAQSFLQDQTVTWAKNILDSNYDDYLAYAAPWADTYREESSGAWSANLHFIDAEDNVPSSCNVNFSRDCPNGCSVSAIQNYTQRVQDTSLSSTQQEDALKFLIHFFGDITQPLHDEAVDVGGNDIDVKFNGDSTNLHHIWDTEMPEQYAGGSAESNSQSWAQNLTTRIQSGDYSSQASSWIQGMDLNDPQGTAMNFASDANRDVCSYVMENGPNSYENQELGGDYYNGAVPIFNLQVAKAGYRLAAWLNLIVTGSTGMEGGSRMLAKRAEDMVFTPRPGGLEARMQPFHMECRSPKHDHVKWSLE